MLFTSGSTGKPKGALLEHRGMLNHMLAKIQDLGMNAADVLAQTAPVTFDISVWQALTGLYTQARIPSCTANSSSLTPPFSVNGLSRTA